MQGILCYRVVCNVCYASGYMTNMTTNYRKLLTFQNWDQVMLT